MIDNIKTIYSIFPIQYIVLLPLLASILTVIFYKVKILKDIISLVIAFILLFLIAFSYDFQYSFKYILKFSNSNIISLTLTNNPLSYLFALISVSGLFLILISSIKTARDKLSFYPLIFMVIFGIMLLIYAGDFITFFIGFEIMTWSSFLIINQSDTKSKQSSLYFIAFNITAAYLLLIGIFILYQSSGTFEYANLSKLISNLSSPKQITALVILTVAFLIKVGTLPFYSWIPGTYTDSPHHFSAFLSSVISKTGIYGLLVLFLSIFSTKIIKSFGLFLDSSLFGYILAWIGVITSIVATFKAIQQDEIKKLLAYSSIAQISYIITAIGVGSSLAISGAIFHTINHAIIKALLFITIAGIIHKTKMKYFYELGGLIYKMPIAFFAVLLGIIGLAGMPPLSGFYSKWLIYVSLLEAKWIIILGGMILSSTAAFVYCYKIIYGIFLGHPTKVNPEETKDLGILYKIPLVLLMLMLVGLGVFPGILTEPINNILYHFDYELISEKSSMILSSSFGSVNGFMVMNVFAGAFMIILILFLLSNKAKTHRVHRLDIYYSGETPDENTPLHYGAGLGKEMRRISFVGIILRNSLKKYYDSLAHHLEELFELLRGIYTGDGQKNIIAAVILVAILSLALILMK